MNRLSNRAAILTSEWTLLARYCALYLATVVIISLMMVPIVNSSYQTAVQNVISESASYLDEGINGFNGDITSVISVASAIQNSAYYSRLAGVKGTPEARDYFAMIKLQEVIRNLFAVNNIENDLYAIFLGNSAIIGRNLIEPLESPQYGGILAINGASGLQLRGLVMAGELSITLMPESDIVRFSSNATRGVALIVKLPVDSLLNTDGAVIGIFELDHIRELMLKHDNRERGFFRINDRYGNRIAGYRDDWLPENLNNTTRLSSNVGDFYVISASGRNPLDYSVIMGVDSSLVFEQVEGIMLIQRIYIVISLTAMACACVALAVIKFRRMRRIYRMLPGGRDVNMRGEYKNLYIALCRLTENRARTALEMERISEQLKNHVIQKLFTKSIYSDDEHKLLHEFAADCFECYIVVKLRAHSLDEKQIAPLFVKLEAFLNELGVSKPLIAQVNTYDLAALMPCPENDASYIERITKGLTEICRYFRESLDCRLFAGVSEVWRGEAGVGDAYTQASYISHKLALSADYGVMAYDSSRPASFAVDLNITQQLYGLISSGNEAGAIALMERTRQAIETHGIALDDSAANLFYSLKNALLHAKRALSADIALPEYDKQRQLNELIDDIKASAIALCRIKASSRPELSSRRGAAVLEYINVHYAETELCAAVIAEKCGIAEKYLYQLVKDAAGMTPGEYIEKTRMCECVRLLLETELSIGDIAARIGFYSQNTFYKTFKRVFGVSPGKYREINAS